MFQAGKSRFSIGKKSAILACLVAIMGFRFYFGLHCPIVIVEVDELQTYLIGLKSYATQTWPSHGTDLVTDGSEPRGQMAGALLGLLIAIPLQIWPSPESPYLFLGLMSFLSLTFLGWYCCKRLPGFPPWFVLLWLYFAPWSLHVSTTVLNQSYAATGAVLFCVGFMESVPSLLRGVLSRSWANVLMGFGLLWMVQLHLSWVMFVPLAAYSLWAQWKEGAFGRALLFGGLGALPMFGLILPTYLAKGFSMVGEAKSYTSLNTDNILAFFTILARFFSYASFEMPRFIGSRTHNRLEYLFQDGWLTAPGLFLWVIGLLQPFLMLFIWFVRNRPFKLLGRWTIRKHPRADWFQNKNLILGALFSIYFLFWFSSKDPDSCHTTEILPFVMVYSFYCWDYLSAWKFWRILGVVLIAVSVYFQAGYALKSARDKASFYDRYKDRVTRAIEAKDYHLLGDRRPGSLY